MRRIFLAKHAKDAKKSFSFWFSFKNENALPFLANFACFARGAFDFVRAELFPFRCRSLIQ
jgi:hypothetical protein